MAHGRVGSLFAEAGYDALAPETVAPDAPGDEAGDEEAGDDGLAFGLEDPYEADEEETDLVSYIR